MHGQHTEQQHHEQNGCIQSCEATRVVIGADGEYIAMPVHGVHRDDSRASSKQTNTRKSKQHGRRHSVPEGTGRVAEVSYM